MKNSKITIQAKILADNSVVWECYTEPEHITNWNFADPSWHCPSAENDLKVGGTYRARMEARDGSFGFDFEAIYDELIDNKKISYNMVDGRNATILFDSNDNATNVTVTFDAESENPIEMQRNGWQSILNNFKNYVEHLR